MRGEKGCSLILKTCIFFIIVIKFDSLSSYSLRNLAVHTNEKMKMAEQEYIHFLKLEMHYSLCCRQFQYAQTYMLIPSYSMDSAYKNSYKEQQQKVSTNYADQQYLYLHIDILSPFN